MISQAHAHDSTMASIAGKLLGSTFLSNKNSNWENPELSTGTWYRKMGRSDCWEAVGSAREIYGQLSKEIKTILEDRIEYLNEDEPIPQTVTFSLYMIGRKPSNARPTIMFCCARPNPRCRARRVIRESGILDKYPGFGMGDSSYPPDFDGLPVRLANTSNSASSNVIIYKRAEKVCGVEISILGSEDDLIRKASIGGIVCSQFKYYGLTVAHAFEELECENATLQLEEGFEFIIEDDEAEGDENSTSTFRGSETSSSSILDHSSASIKSAQTSKSKNLSAFISTPRVATPVESSTVEAVLGDTPHSQPSGNTQRDAKNIENPGLKIANDEQFSVVGSLILRSTYGNSPELDWGLIELETPHLRTYNRVPLNNNSDGVLYPEKVVTTGLRATDVLVLRGSGEPLSGILSGIPTFMNVPRSKKFHEVWTMRLNGKLAKGDCGSWVIDAVTGDIFGHIVSGDLDSGSAFLMPAFQIFEDIKQSFGIEILLSTRENQSAIKNHVESAPDVGPAVTPSIRSEPRWSEEEVREVEVNEGTHSIQIVRSTATRSASAYIGISGLFRHVYDWLLKKFWGIEMSVTVIGLQNAGKTSLLRALVGEEFQYVSLPTVGFNMKRFQKGRVTLKCWDLGGQPRFRSMWERYCRGVDAIVFVVDADDTEAIPMARGELHLLIEKPILEGIPLLVLGNKNDLEKPLKVSELVDILALRTISNREVSCYGVSVKEEFNLDQVLHWLVSKARK